MIHTCGAAVLLLLTVFAPVTLITVGFGSFSLQAISRASWVLSAQPASCLERKSSARKQPLLGTSKPCKTTREAGGEMFAHMRPAPHVRPDRQGDLMGCVTTRDVWNQTSLIFWEIKSHKAVNHLAFSWSHCPCMEVLLPSSVCSLAFTGGIGWLSLHILRFQVILLVTPLLKRHLDCYCFTQLQPPTTKVRQIVSLFIHLVNNGDVKAD